MHRGAFTRSNKLKLAAVLREKPLAGAFGNSLAPQKSRLFPTKFLFHELFSKNIRNIFLKQVPIQKLSSPHCDEMEGREIRRSRPSASALKSGQGPPGRVLAVRQFSPLRRREGPPPPAAGESVRPKSPAFYGVLCSSDFFPFFGSCGSRWVNMGQHRPQDGPT